MIPAPVLEHIETITGREHGRRTPRTRTCPHCSARILEGLDDDVMAVTVRVDPWPVTDLAEIIAHLAGRGAYSLIRGELHRRDTLQLGDHRWPVLAGHTCHLPLPAAPTQTAAKRVLPVDPPF